MKFSFKLLFSTIIVMAVALGFSGFYFVNFVFETSLSREIEQAMDENSILRFAFETAALNIPVKYNVLQDYTVDQIATNLEIGGNNNRRLLRISDEGKNVLYESEGFEADNNLLMQTNENTRTYQVVEKNKHYYIQAGITLNTLNRILYLETMRDVTEVFEERALGFSVYRRVTVIMLICGTAIMYLIASLLTSPIRLLTRATEKMAEGEYNYRAKQVSNDELGQLTADFNKMAAALEDNIKKLEEEVKAREDFVAAFAHELKTPLTSIIGYADMLRSRKLDEEKSFMSANYIYTEGKRLEAMSFRLLDIIVTKRREIKLQTVQVEHLFSYLQNMFKSNEEFKSESEAFPNSLLTQYRRKPAICRGYKFVFEFDEGTVKMEVDLIKAVLMNIVDNARKASEEGGLIEIKGELLEDGYRFSVKDYGVGIPIDEQSNITKAFYMVDKSRSRSKNGAGLGLTLCEEILQLHNSGLEIESKAGQGACISFVLQVPDGEEVI